MNQIQDSVNGIGFCETPTARGILQVLHTCYLDPRGGIGLIVGNAGIGKTTTIKHFAARNEGVQICTMDRTMGTMVAALSAICKKLTGHPAPKRAREISEVIINFLAWNGLILIIDEAQNLNDEVIDQLRHIYDELQEDGGGIGLVLCGNAGFKNRFNHAEAAAFAQVTSRIGPKALLAEPTDDDIELICDFRKISGSAERKFIRRCSHSSGALRTVMRLINYAGTLPDIGKPITVDHLKLAAGMMGINRQQ